MRLLTILFAAVIASGLSKQLCVGLFPQLANVEHVTEPDCRTIKLMDVGSSKSMEWEILKRDHKVYAALHQVLTKLKSSPIECIAEAFSASSTDNYPDESIVNTQDPRDRYSRRASYWSSKGHKDPSVPETLIYKLKADLCVITEIDIRPFEGKNRWNSSFVTCTFLEERMFPLVFYGFCVYMWLYLLFHQFS